VEAVAVESAKEAVAMEVAKVVVAVLEEVVQVAVADTVACVVGVADVGAQEASMVAWEVVMAMVEQLRQSIPLWIRRRNPNHATEESVDSSGRACIQRAVEW